MTGPSPSITIRTAYADDHVALRRLAALDSAELPPMPLIIAEVDGELRAALSLRDGAAIADPFAPTLHLLALLSLHASVSNRSVRQRSARRPLLRRLVPRLD